MQRDLSHLLCMVLIILTRFSIFGTKPCQLLYVRMLWTILYSAEACHQYSVLSKNKHNKHSLCEVNNP
ncbi:hypothetical protein XELAEV_18025174mg [Xenopus laevis]|uniref:Secreted protein n=1 Tax=Xenopus laevis TaxID=8355 RepID=A0A974CZE0_XENLA|nr:hypothetical protein XELAEV_18025174mg [Xenopus laevis]